MIFINVFSNCSSISNCYTINTGNEILLVPLRTRGRECLRIKRTMNCKRTNRAMRLLKGQRYGEKKEYNIVIRTWSAKMETLAFEKWMSITRQLYLFHMSRFPWKISFHILFKTKRRKKKERRDLQPQQLTDSRLHFLQLKLHTHHSHCSGSYVQLRPLLWSEGHLIPFWKSPNFSWLKCRRKLLKF